MQNIISNKSKLKGGIIPPSSKSHSIRALLFGSLANGKSTISGLLKSPDIYAMQKACMLIGANITSKDDVCEIIGCNGSPKANKRVLDVSNSGQVLRFMTAILALQNNEVTLIGDKSASLRPMQPLIDAISELGCLCRAKEFNGVAPIIVKGPITKNQTSIIGNDSQFVSALLMTLPFVQHPVEFKVIKPGEKPWVDFTCFWLDRVGITYEREEYESFKFQGKAEIAPFNYKVPADFSSMAFLLVAALITQSCIEIKNLDFLDHQGDRKIIDICIQMGAKLEISGNSLKTFPSSLHGITIDLNSCIDAVPILCVLATVAKGETKLTNIKVARTKECDRLNAITKELAKMRADIREGENFLVIRQSKLVPATVSSYHDHRIAMSLVVAGFVIEGATTVLETDCIKKSYPNFVKDMQSLGCKVDII